MNPTRLGDWLSEAPFSLAMSSGFFGFFAHAGVLAALDESRLQPKRLSGSSAGALVSVAYAAGLAPTDLIEALQSLRREDFWDPGRFYGITQGGLLRGERFHRKVEALLPVNSFDACTKQVAVSAFEVPKRRTIVIDQGELASAVVASCAVPGLFRPVRREGQLLLDGGILDRPGLAGMPTSERVLFHHLASKSPWRNDTSMRLPKRQGLTSLVLESLPRSGPNALDQGLHAMRLAKEACLRALDQPITHSHEEGSVVRLHAR